MCIVKQLYVDFLHEVSSYYVVSETTSKRVSTIEQEDLTVPVPEVKEQEDNYCHSGLLIQVQPLQTLLGSIHNEQTDTEQVAWASPAEQESHIKIEQNSAHL